MTSLQLVMTSLTYGKTADPGHCSSVSEGAGQARHFAFRRTVYTSRRVSDGHTRKHKRLGNASKPAGFFFKLGFTGLTAINPGYLHGCGVGALSTLYCCTPCPKKTKQICFCRNFVKFPPISIIFGTKMRNDPNICEVHSLSTSPNLRHHLTVLNAYKSQN